MLQSIKSHKWIATPAAATFVERLLYHRRWIASSFHCCHPQYLSWVQFVV